MITQQQLEQRLLAACNCLRGPVDPIDYKAYIFPLLFLKRISDYWDWEYSRALEAFDGDEELARLDDNYRFVLPEADPEKGLPGCHWEDVRDLQENVGVGLQTILQRIELANSDTLAGIFGDVQWANKEKLPEHTLLNAGGRRAAEVAARPRAAVRLGAHRARCLHGAACGDLTRPAGHAVGMSPPASQSPVLRLVRRLAEHAEEIYVWAERDGEWTSLAYAELTPDEQAAWLDEWTCRVLEGWEGPFTVKRR